MDSSSSSEDEKLSEAISPELLQFMNKKTQQKQEKKVESKIFTFLLCLGQ